MNKHIIWALTLLSIVLIICGTMLYINHNSWTVRFEMDDNTKEAIESIEWASIYPDVKDKPLVTYWNYSYASVKEINYSNDVRCLNAEETEQIECPEYVIYYPIAKQEKQDE